MKQGQSSERGERRPLRGQRIHGSSVDATPITGARIRRSALIAGLVCCIGCLSTAVGQGPAAAAGATASNRSSTTSSSAGGSQSQISSTEAQVSALATQIAQQQSVLAQADERYNQAQVDLTATRASVRATTASIAAARVKLLSERTQLRSDAVKAYIDDTSSSAAAALFSAPTSASQIRNLYRTLSASTVAADVARVKASQEQLAGTQAKLLAAQQVQTAQLSVASQTRQSVAAVNAQSEATLAEVKGTLAQQVAQQAAVQAAAAARAAAAATTPAKAQAAASQAAQASQVATTVSSGSTAAVNATSSASQAAGSAAASGGSSGAAPVAISGGAAPFAQGLAALHAAEQYVGIPYLYGGPAIGASPTQGLDCSGLTMLAWGQAGVSLPHSAADQYMQSTHVSMSALEPGDLIFYQLGGSSIIDHVVMYVGGNTVIEARHTGTLVGYYPYWSAGVVGAGRPHS